MASKTTAARRESAKSRKAKEVMALSARAKAEVEKLLTRSDAGNITRIQLDTGLREVEQRLNRMLAHIRHLL